MKCPGQDTQYWKPGAIYDAKCPECETVVEFFKDDTTRKCSNCGHRFINPELDFGCASYCQFAEQCIGNLPPELIAQKEDLLKDRVAIEMKKYFRADFKRISHAMRVARYAERIGISENGNLAVVLASAYLHDIGILEAEKKYNSAAAEHHEAVGVPIARDILEKLGAAEPLVEAVCDIIGHHHHPRAEEDPEFKTVFDADLIANLENDLQENPMDAEKIRKIITEQFMTRGGRREAEKVLID
jgi:predicted HD phosphohydrolase